MNPTSILRNLLRLCLLWLLTGWTAFSQIDPQAYERLNRLIRNKPMKAEALLNQLIESSDSSVYSQQQLRLASIKLLTARGEYDEALELCLSQLDHMQDTIPENYVLYLTYLGNIYYFARQRNSAIELYEEGLQYGQAHNLDEFYTARLHSNLGGMFAEKAEYERSEFHLRRSIELSSRTSKVTSSIPYRLLGTNYWMQERYAEARPILRDAIDRAWAYGDSLEISGAYLFYGDVLEKLGQPDSAIVYYQKGLEVVEETDNPDMELEAYKHLKELYPQLGDFVKAYQSADMAYHLQNQIYQKDLAQQISQLKVKYETDKLIQENETRLAQLESEKVKSRLRLLIVIALVIVALFIALIALAIIRQLRMKRKAAEQKSIIKLQEERLRISRELHDNIGAQITVIISSLDNLEWQSKRKKAVDEDQIQKLSGFTRQTMQELRETVWAMKKESITGTELDIRIRDYLNSVAELCPDITFSFEGLNKDSFVFDPAQGVNLYRIVQEAVQNSIKHGEASNITVRTYLEDDRLRAEITDDGRGFDAETVNRGNGLQNMQNRAYQNEIKLELQTATGKGTRVLLEI